MLDQLNRFNDIIFDPEPHTYHLNGVEFTSATTWLHQFQEPFDADAISLRMAKGNKQQALELQRQWKAKSDAACSRGTHLHEYLECKIAGADVALHDDALDLYPIADRFLADTKDKIKIVAQEFRLYDEAWKLCGTVDALGQDNAGNYYLIDWKSNSKFTTSSDYNKMLKYPFNALEDCHLNTYSIQLSLYKLLLERNTDIRIKGLILVHFTPKNWLRYVALDLTKEIIYFLRDKQC